MPLDNTDREAIHELILRWCRAIDRLDLEAIRNVFHDDAYDDHGTFKGGVDALIDWLRGRHAGIPFSMHSVSNCLMDQLDEDQVLVETYCIALQKYPAASLPNLEALVGPLTLPQAPFYDMTVACRYLDIVTRRNGVWKIWRRTVVFDNASVIPGLDIPDPRAIGWVTGHRFGLGPSQDHVYNLLQRGNR
ncbi:hypothetical protein ACSSV8_003693 [Roseovarius sp. MBR-79]|jgi:hypothetical protein